jgi:hypothetical protein
LRGAFSRGGFDSANYRTFINHSLTYSVSYYYKEENLGIFYSFFPFYFQPTIQESGDFQYLAATQNSNMKMYFVINPNNTGKYRPCSGDRIGYYNNSKYVNNKANLNLDYFPLDPA